MLKKHSFSPNHKVVEKSPHNFSMPGGSAGPGNMTSSGSGGSAEPAGGGAQGPEPAMFADGGEPAGGSMSDVWNQMTQPQPGRRTKSALPQQSSEDSDSDSSPPAASGSGYKASGSVGKSFDDSIDKAVKDAGG